MKKAIIGLVTILVIFTSMFSVIVAKRKYIFANQKFYTEQELKTEYNKGYDKGAEENRDEALYQKLKELTVSNIQYQKQVEDLTKQKEELETENTGLNSTIAGLKNIKAENELTINSLQETITSNEKSISDLTIEKNKLQNKVNELNSEIETLKSSSDSEKETLQNLINSKTAQIESLNNQITTLQANISQLQETNRLNTNTITSLNTQIANLNSQISDMTLASQNSTSRINALTNKINQLQESITYYENFIAQLENEEKVVATFEYDGSVYNIQIVNKGSIVTVTAPTATEDKIFNGWKVDGELVDLSTYTINSNTKFVADITYKQKVVFKTDTETTYNTQYVIKGQYATLPTAPTKAGYEFDGWSINGVDIVENIETTAVNENTTYIAVFTKLHSVTFLYETETKDSQQVRNGSYATNVTVEDTTYKIFNGWTVNGTLVDITTYKIVADTVFVADITYKYDVKFMVDETEYNSQIVTAGSYPTLPIKPTKEGYTFKGWSIDGSNIIENVETMAVNNNVTYIAVFKQSGWVEKNWNGLTSIDSNHVWTDGEDTYYSYNDKQFILNKNTSTWEIKQWFGVSSSVSFYGVCIFKAFNKVYLLTSDSYDGTLYFYSLNKETSVWTLENFDGLSSLRGNVVSGSKVWTDGEKYYLSVSMPAMDINYQYEFDFENKCIIEKDFGNYAFSGDNVWTDGVDIYVSRGNTQLIFDFNTKKFNLKTWNNLKPDFGSYIWNFDGETYYSYGSKQYVLNMDEIKFELKQWSGLVDFYAYIWTDGEYTYYSDGSKNYQLIG